MKVIAIACEKGGVAKTTTAVNLAQSLTKLKHKTLLIDADKQHNSTFNYGAQYEGVATLYDVILDPNPCSIEEAIQHTPNGDIVAGDPQLAEAGDAFRGVEGAYYKLREALADLKGYDYVIFDTNMVRDSLLYTVLAASDYVIIPTVVHSFAYQGVTQVCESIAVVRQNLNPKLRLSGIVVCNYPLKSKVSVSHQIKLEALHKYAAQADVPIFDTIIHNSQFCANAQDEQIALSRYRPSISAAKDYMKFAREVIAQTKGE